jgi:transcriptional regulator with XRE-family HTH domain
MAIHGQDGPSRSRHDPRTLGQYLRARRSLVRPEDVGLPFGGTRRVDGLRREEVAAAAGISSEYYLRLEQGRDHQPSEQVIAALATALRLDSHGARYLHDLVRPPAERRSQPDRIVSPSIRALVRQLDGSAAFVLDRNQDVIFGNRAAHRLSPAMRVGSNRLLALFDDDSSENMLRWHDSARDAVAALRRAGVPRDPRFQAIVGQLSIRSTAFRELWARHDVGPLRGGVLAVDVAPFGRLELPWRPFELPECDQTLVMVSGNADTPARAALAYLAHEHRGREDVRGVARAQT